MSPVTKHELIFIDEVLLNQFYHFNWYDQRNWDHGIDEDEICKENDDRVDWRWVRCPVDVVKIVFSLVSEDTVKNSDHHTEKDLNTKHDSQYVIDLVLDLRHFFRGFRLWIFHNFSVLSCIRSQTKNVICVFQFSSTIQELLVTSNNDGVVVNYHCAVEMV